MDRQRLRTSSRPTMSSMDRRKTRQLKRKRGRGREKRAGERRQEEQVLETGQRRYKRDETGGKRGEEKDGDKKEAGEDEDEDEEEGDAEEEGEDGEDEEEGEFDLLTCEVCESAQYKYKCPRCEKRTCSVACIAKHKKRSHCSGKRNRTEFRHFTLLDQQSFMNDYFLLEDAANQAENAARLGPPAYKKTRNAAKPALQYLAEHLKTNGSCTQLHHMSIGMSRHDRNTSYYNKKRKMVMWKIEIIFNKSTFAPTNLMGENLKLSSIIERELQKNYQQFASSYQISLKKYGCAANSIEFHELDKEKSIKDNLAGLALLEYPTFYVTECKG